MNADYQNSDEKHSLEGAQLVAIDIGGTKIASALVGQNASGSLAVTSIERVATRPLEGGAAVLARVIEAVHGSVARADAPVAGVGISTGGVVNPVTGDITYANEMMPGWSGTKLGSAVTAATGLDCRVLNDVHAHALGEARMGAGKPYHSVVVVAIGTGISGAVVEDGLLRLGSHDMAANVGHMAVAEAAGLPCTCGAEGHLEMVAAGPAIVEEFQRLSHMTERPDGTPVDGAFIAHLAGEGSAEALAAITRSGRALGTVLGSVANFQDPEAIVLSGSVVQAGVVWWDALKAAYEACAMQPVRTLPIVQGTLGEAAPLLGAALNFLHDGYGLGSH